MLKVFKQNNGTVVRTPDQTILVFGDRQITLDPTQDTAEQMVAEWVKICKELEHTKLLLATSERVVAEFRGLV
jgi:hypothetical protein